tara:strand:- start:1 stop:618 length:618 start_codon:yes stop_codon:yes gene_type:complete
MKKLVFFDFDYTIAKTYEFVRLWSPRGTKIIDNRLYIPLTPEEYNSIQIESDEFIDRSSFEEFKKVNLQKATKLNSVCLLFESYSLMGHDVRILSARPQIAEEYIHEFMNKNSLNYNKQTPFKGCDSSQPELKYSYIKKCMELNNYREVLLFDDSRKVIDHVINKFEQDYDNNTVLTTCLVELHGHEEVLRYKNTHGKKKINKAM